MKGSTSLLTLVASVWTLQAERPFASAQRGRDRRSSWDYDGDWSDEEDGSGNGGSSSGSWEEGGIAPVEFPSNELSLPEDASIKETYDWGLLLRVSNAKLSTLNSDKSTMNAFVWKATRAIAKGLQMAETDIDVLKVFDSDGSDRPTLFFQPLSPDEHSRKRKAEETVADWRRQVRDASSDLHTDANTAVTLSTTSSSLSQPNAITTLPSLSIDASFPIWALSAAVVTGMAEEPEEDQLAAPSPAETEVPGEGIEEEPPIQEEEASDASSGGIITEENQSWVIPVISVGGGIVGLALIAAIVWCCYKRKQLKVSRKATRASETVQQQQPTIIHVHNATQPAPPVASNSIIIVGGGDGDDFGMNAQGMAPPPTAEHTHTHMYGDQLMPDPSAPPPSYGDQTPMQPPPYTPAHANIRFEPQHSSAPPPDTSPEGDNGRPSGGSMGSPFRTLFNSLLPFMSSQSPQKRRTGSRAQETPHTPVGSEGGVTGRLKSRMEEGRGEEGEGEYDDLTTRKARGLNTAASPRPSRAQHGGSPSVGTD
mmetsp:Transcript_3013/g.6151  ORF Transcript_3013/g.6151 Transcript_3013/m.6151 type:complete len:538 (+) Transcript_3013:131-1744(+)